MQEVTVEDLETHSNEVLGRVSGGECLTVTQAGRPVAELRPAARPAVQGPNWIEEFRDLPDLDAAAFRHDIDSLFDQSL
ncbi:MAG TPA: type II toxin-antitoxin system prevent-host-death family antitoxin [Acidimicrobiales bacterium]|jgi:prevent-host-death family protein